MKKILFIMPLMAISLLASCNNGGSSSKDAYTVTEQELKDAFAMKGVKYLQVVDTVSELEEIISTKVTCSFTPTSFHIINEEGEKYSETLVIKDGHDSYHKYQRSSKDAELKPIEYQEGDFITINNFADAVFANVRDIKYDDYYYNKEKKEYLTYLIESSVTLLSFKFYNKKIVNFAAFDYVKEKDMFLKDESSFTYDQIEPPTPPSI